MTVKKRKARVIWVYYNVFGYVQGFFEDEKIAKEYAKSPCFKVVKFKEVL